MTQTGRTLTFTATLLTIAFAFTDSGFTQAQAPPVRAVARGPYAVTVESYNTLPTHTTYHPTDPRTTLHASRKCRSSRGI